MCFPANHGGPAVANPLRGCPVPGPTYDNCPPANFAILLTNRRWNRHDLPILHGVGDYFLCRGACTAPAVVFHARYS